MTGPSLLHPTDEDFMRMALKEAGRAAEAEEVPVGCVIVDKNRVIGRAGNQCETLTDPTAHAEMLALTQAFGAMNSQRLTDAIVYVTLEPCPMCASALVLARVRKIIFATPDPKGGGVVSKYQIPTEGKLNHTIAVEQGLLAEEASELLQSFFRKIRKLKGKTEAEE